MSTSVEFPYKGDNLALTITLTENNETINLSGSVVSLKIRRGHVEFEQSGTIVTVSGSAVCRFILTSGGALSMRSTTQGFDGTVTVSLDGQTFVAYFKLIVR